MFKFSIRELIWLTVIVGLLSATVKYRVEIVILKNKIEAKNLEMVERQIEFDKTNKSLDSHRQEIMFIEKLLSREL